MISRRIRALVLSGDEFAKNRGSLKADTALWL